LWDSSKPSFALSLSVLHTSLLTGLKLLHPFMPFITEELYHRLPIVHEDEKKIASISIDAYPSEEEVLGKMFNF
jgi:valyl-tRNA synthetase